MFEVIDKITNERYKVYDTNYAKIDFITHEWGVQFLIYYNCTWQYISADLFIEA